MQSRERGVSASSDASSSASSKHSEGKATSATRSRSRSGSGTWDYSSGMPGKAACAQTGSTFKMRVSEFDVPLPPSYIGHELVGVTEIMNGMLLKYSRAVGGVPLAYRNVELAKPMGSIQLHSANVFVRARAEFLVYAADASIVQRGEVSVVTASHLQLVLLKSIPVFIPASALPEGYTFDADAKYWKLDRKVAKASPGGAIRVIKEGTRIPFRALELKQVGSAWWVKGVPNSNKSAIIDEAPAPAAVASPQVVGRKRRRSESLDDKNPASDPESPAAPSRSPYKPQAPAFAASTGDSAAAKRAKKEKRRRRRRKK